MTSPSPLSPILQNSLMGYCHLLADPLPQVGAIIYGWPQVLFLQQEESKYSCFWMASTQSGGEPKLVCIPKLNIIDVIRMN